jgi:two-component system NtrC family sensor kinase
MKAALPANEVARLEALYSYNILDSLPEREYQDIVKLASLICEAPIALVSLVDQDRQWFKAKVGMDAVQTERDVAFCAHALHQPDALMVVPDTSQDPRFFDNPLVTDGLHIGFYAGAPLKTEAGLVLGTLCVIDRMPRILSAAQKAALTALARQVMSQLELRQKIAEVQETQAQLLQAEKMASIGQLAAGVAHEINNPVGFVRSNMNTLSKYAATLFEVIDRSESLLVEGMPDAAAMAAFREAADRADLPYLKTDMGELITSSLDGLNRVKDIIRALQDFSHAGEVDWQLADLHAGIESTLKIASSTIARTAVVIRQYGDLPPVNCLVSQINQVLMNLLVNAAQAITANGTITVKTSCDEKWVRIAISDTGKGIQPENLTSIFDPFYTTKPVGYGTGLGLSISYNIIKKHGGRIDVTSTPGIGTTFTVWLPRTAAALH